MDAGEPTKDALPDAGLLFCGVMAWRMRERVLELEACGAAAVSVGFTGVVPRETMRRGVLGRMAISPSAVILSSTSSVFTHSFRGTTVQITKI